MEEFMPEKLREEWAKAIGDFIIGMGEIEELMNEVLRLSLDINFYNILKKNALSQKCDLAREIFKKWMPKENKEIDKIFEELSKLRGKRNIVAHNALSVEIYVNQDLDKHVFDFSITDMTKPDKAAINLSTLKDDTKSLNSIFHRLFNFIPNDKESLKLLS